MCFLPRSYNKQLCWLFQFGPFTQHPNEKRDKLTYRFAYLAHLTIPDPGICPGLGLQLQLLRTDDVTGLRRVAYPLPLAKEFLSVANRSISINQLLLGCDAQCPHIKLRVWWMGSGGHLGISIPQFIFQTVCAAGSGRSRQSLHK